MLLSKSKFITKKYYNLLNYDQIQKDFQRKGIEYDPLKQEAIVDEIKETYSANYFLTNGVSGSPSDIPVFIVGMPRSGTTLTDQILAMHPKITSIGCGRKLS